MICHLEKKALYTLFLPVAIVCFAVGSPFIPQGGLNDKYLAKHGTQNAKLPQRNLPCRLL